MELAPVDVGILYFEPSVIYSALCLRRQSLRIPNCIELKVETVQQQASQLVVKRVL